MTRAMRVALRLSFSVFAVAATASSAFGATAPTPVRAPTTWGCLPGMANNPCDGLLATTYLGSTFVQPRRVSSVDEPPRSPDSGVDCFYVYPTVSSALTENAPARMASEIRAIYRYQAARFSQVCRVYAPLYRQVSLLGILGRVTGGEGDGRPAAPASIETAYGDVVAAWDEYLARYNRGRGVVLIGHSQGSGMLIRLLRDRIDASPRERSRLVSAIVPGGDLTVATGARTGGDLQAIPTCARTGEIGCVIAYSAFAHRPPRGALFGRPYDQLRSFFGLASRPGTEVACVNPAELSGSGDRLLPITRTEPFPSLIGAGLALMFYGAPPRAATPWVVPGDQLRASCRQTGRAHVLAVRAGTRASTVPLESPTPDWGLHLADINLPLGNLVRIVEAQAATWKAANPATVD